MIYDSMSIGLKVLKKKTSLPLECKVNNNANNMSSKYEDNLLLVGCMENTNVICIYQKCTHLDLS